MVQLPRIIGAVGFLQPSSRKTYELMVLVPVSGSADRTEGLSDNGIKVEPEHSEDWELPDEIDLMYEPDLPINSQASTRLPRWTEIGQRREAEAPG